MRLVAQTRAPLVHHYASVLVLKAVGVLIPRSAVSREEMVEDDWQARSTHFIMNFHALVIGIWHRPCPRFLYLSVALRHVCGQPLQVGLLVCVAKPVPRK